MGSPSLAFPNIDAAIGSQEGFGKPGTIATNNNNPGDIIYGPFAVAHGATGAANGFAVFPDVTTGTGAEDSLVQYYSNQGASLSDLINAWSPGTAPGNTPAGTSSYIDYVSGLLGVSPDSSIPDAEKGPNTSTPTTGSGTTGSTTLNNILKAFGDIGQGVMGGVPILPSQSASFFGLSLSQLGTFLAGLIVIAGGIFLFKPVSNTIIKYGKRGIEAASA